MLGPLPHLVLRLFARIRNKIRSILVSGAFKRYGKHSVIEGPLRLVHPEHIEIGRGVFLGGDCWLQALPQGLRKPRLVIGNRVTASGACVFSAAEEVVIEDGVLLARNVYISDHIHGYADTSRPIRDQGVSKIQPVRIEAGAWLGQNVVVCPGVTIGRGTVVGANSVVTESVPAFCVAVGAPAQVVKQFAGTSS